MNRKLLFAATGLAAALGAAPLAHAQGYGYGPGMMGGWGGGSGMIGMLLWWVLIIVAIVLLVKWFFGGSPGRGGQEPGDRSLAILNERYARGEIDRKEFEDRKRDLGV